MMDKERLECIKERHEVANVNYHAKNFAEMKVILEQLFLEEDTDWLIQQVERIQELELEIRALKTVATSNKKIGEECLKENRRYREVLEFYALGRHWVTSLKDGGDYVNEYGELAEKALEESK